MFIIYIFPFFINYSIIISRIMEWYNQVMAL